MNNHLQTKTTANLKTALLLPVFLLAAVAGWAQATISGRVLDDKGKPVPGANVYLDNTLDGGTSDSTGTFKFTTTEQGNQTLMATNVGYDNAGMPVNITGDLTGIELKMKYTARSLEEVVVTAGSFEAGNGEKTVLKPLDIVTTAGTGADVVRAIQTLPGTQQQGTQTGLFVRGGDASEAAFVVDGLVAQNAFLTTAPGVAARSRFGPFQFKGVAFSSGGYSARYGQALSSVLELSSNDMPDKSTINTGINMAGVYFSGSKLNKKTSLEGSAYYNNLTPFYKLAKTNVDYYNVPKGGGGSARFVYTPNKNGILKAMVNYSTFSSGTRVPNPEPGQEGKDLTFGVTNNNVYSNVSYKQMLNSKWNLYTAASYSYNKDDIEYNTYPINSDDNRMQLRAEVKHYATTRLSILAGTEIQHFGYNRDWKGPYPSTNSFTETQAAGYVEADWAPKSWIALKPGVRVEHSALINQSAISPRFAMAIKSGMHGQFSVASGIFYQTVDPSYLLYGYRPGFQQAIHYIANYQYMKGDRTFRIEGYYKDYNQLIREFTPAYDPNSYRVPYGSVNNSGYGYATGAELFWRDKKTVKNGDYWISYSYIDTRRLFKNYPTEAQPDFIANHNLNVVTKYFFTKLQTQVNLTYNYSSGRPFYNPSNPTFLGDRTPDFNNLSLTVNYLTSVKKWFTVIYAGIDNITNARNVFGYRYGTDGTRYPMRPALYRSFFVGVNFSLTEFDKDEL